MYYFTGEEVHLRHSILIDEVTSGPSYTIHVCQYLITSTVELRMAGNTTIVSYDTASLLNTKAL